MLQRTSAAALRARRRPGAGAQVGWLRCRSFKSSSEYLASLESEHCTLPLGFRVGTSSFKFVPQEAPLPNTMTLTLIVPDEPTSQWGAVFTQNAFPGAPIKIGRELLSTEKLGAIVINNKISNVCAQGGGVEDSKRLCSAISEALQLPSDCAVLPSSTGVIGWKLPIDDLVAAAPGAVASLQADSILPAAEGILTTDLYAKVSSAEVAGGRIVGIAKGAGMIEPNMATMLAYVLTDIDLPRELLRDLLSEVVDGSFNSISVDSDQSTSDTLAMISSGKVPFGGSNAEVAEIRTALTEVCRELAELIVRNGEGCNHLIQVVVTGGATAAEAKGVGKAVVNSPLFKCAVAGNDPNVGRLASSIGDYIGNECGGGMDALAKCEISMGGRVLCANGEFVLDHETETYLMQHMKDAEQVVVSSEDGSDAYPNYPPHRRAVEIEVSLGRGDGCATVLGSDLTHEYVTINGSRSNAECIAQDYTQVVFGGGTYLQLLFQRSEIMCPADVLASLRDTWLTTELRLHLLEQGINVIKTFY